MLTPWPADVQAHIKGECFSCTSIIADDLKWGRKGWEYEMPVVRFRGNPAAPTVTETRTVWVCECCAFECGTCKYEGHPGVIVLNKDRELHRAIAHGIE